MSEPGAPLAPGQPGTSGSATPPPPSVWAECPRCGQRSHISASSCPSCGSPLAEDDEGEPTQAMPTVEDAAKPTPAPPAPEQPLAPPTASAPPSPRTPAPLVSGPATTDGAALIAGLVRDTRVSPRVVPTSSPTIDASQAEAFAVAPAAPAPPSAPPSPPSIVPTAPTGHAGPRPQPDRPAPSPAPEYPPHPGYPPAPPGQLGHSAPLRPDLRPAPANRGRRTISVEDRSPSVLIGAGVGLGLLLLLAVVLLVRAIGGDPPDAGSAAPSSTASAISSTAITAAASSTQDPEGGITYSAENTLDGRAETAWNSDGRADGKGPGMVLTYRFADPVELSAITVLNGYQKTLQNPGRTPSDLFALNSRVRSWRVTTDSGTWVWDLADDRSPQTLAKQFGTTSSVRFEVLSVYPGSKYLDLAVSEVSFAGL